MPYTCLQRPLLKTRNSLTETIHGLHLGDLGVTTMNPFRAPASDTNACGAPREKETGAASIPYMSYVFLIGISLPWTIGMCWIFSKVFNWGWK